MSMDRVLYLQNDNSLGGSAQSLLTLVRHMSREKYEPAVVSVGMGALYAKLAESRIEVRSAPLHLFGYMDTHYVFGQRDREASIFRRFFMEFIETVRLLAAIPAQRRLLRQLCSDYQPDLLHINSATLLAVGCVCRSLDVPSVWHVREVLADNFWGRVTGWLIPRCATLVIAISQAVAKRLDQSLGNVRVVYNAVDLQYFNSSISGDSARAEMSVPPNVPCIGYVGKLIPSKGVFDFVESASSILAEFPNAHFLLVGGNTGESAELAGTRLKRFVKHLLGYQPVPDYQQRLKERIAKLRLTEQFHFAGSRSDLPRWFAAMDIVVLPTWTEAFGRTIVEAMAMGKPVVSTTVDAVPELIENGRTGLLCAPACPEELAAKVTSLLLNPDSMVTLGNSARASVIDRFSVEHHAKLVTAVYDSIVHI